MNYKFYLILFLSVFVMPVINSKEEEKLTWEVTGDTRDAQKIALEKKIVHSFKDKSNKKILWKLQLTTKKFYWKKILSFIILPESNDNIVKDIKTGYTLEIYTKSEIKKRKNMIENKFKKYCKRYGEEFIVFYPNFLGESTTITSISSVSKDYIGKRTCYQGYVDIELSLIKHNRETKKEIIVEKIIMKDMKTTVVAKSTQRKPVKNKQR